MDVETKIKEEERVESGSVTGENSNNKSRIEKHDMAACNGFVFPASESEHDNKEPCESEELNDCHETILPGIDVKVNAKISDKFNFTADAPSLAKVVESHVSSLPKLKVCKLLCADYRSCSSTNDSESESVSVSDSKIEFESESESSSISDVGSHWNSEDSETENNASSNESEDSSRNKEKSSDTESQSSKKKNCDLEISDLPPIEKLKISVPEDECVEIGYVSGIVDSLVVIEAYKGTLALDIDTVLFLDKGKSSLGRIFDVIGPVTEPVYIVRFNNAAEIAEANITKNEKIYCAPKTEYSTFVFVSELMKIKGSDASWKNNKEVPLACQDFSDDEEERKFKSLLQNSEDAAGPVASAKPPRKRPIVHAPKFIAPVSSLPFQSPFLFRTPLNQYPMFGMHPVMYPVPSAYLPFFALPPPPPPPPLPPLPPQPSQCQVHSPAAGAGLRANNFCNPTLQTNLNHNYHGPVTSFTFNFSCPPVPYPFPGGPGPQFNFPWQQPPGQPGANPYSGAYRPFVHPQQPVFPPPFVPRYPFPAQRPPPAPRHPLPSQKPLSSQKSPSPSSPYRPPQTTTVSTPQVPAKPLQQPFPALFAASSENHKPLAARLQMASKLVNCKERSILLNDNKKKKKKKMTKS